MAVTITNRLRKKGALRMLWLEHIGKFRISFKERHDVGTSRLNFPMSLARFLYRGSDQVCGDAAPAKRVWDIGVVQTNLIAGHRVTQIGKLAVQARLELAALWNMPDLDLILV
ncbi:MAG: hypothetical protein ABSA83_00340 [Verrucomicrobiota bacterium]